MKQSWTFVMMMGMSFGLTACGRLSVSGSEFANAAAEGQIQLRQIDGQGRKDWKLDETDRAFVASNRLTLKGVCNRGVKSVQAVLEGENIGVEVPCGVNGEFVWKGLMRDGVYPITLKPILEGRDEKPIPVEQTIVVDTLAPPRPVIITNDGKEILSFHRDVEIEGRLVGDGVAVREVAARGEGLTLNKKVHFSVDVNVNPGATKVVSFVAVDFAGNISDPVSIEVSNLASMNIIHPAVVAEITTAPTVSSGSGNLVMESSNIAPILVAHSGRIAMGFPGIQSMVTEYEDEWDDVATIAQLSRRR